MYDAAGDHGVKAQGDGWLTTVTLIEGENIAPTDSGTSNPYVVFTCNGKTRTSSVKLRTSHPSWRGKVLVLRTYVYGIVFLLLSCRLPFNLAKIL